jgi:nicotinamide phosphoribosyltransferase
MTAWGKEGEIAAFKNMLDQFSGPGKLVAVVSDSYDLWNAIDNVWGDALKEQVESTGGTLVVRPDSGNPVEVVIETIERLMAKFGYETNSKGYRMLPDAVKVDGVWRDVYKDPVTDHGKRSKKGRLAVIESPPGTYQTIPEAELGSRKNILETVYRNGKLIREFSFDEVRENASW